jgi:hypothetical protein
MLQVCCSLLFTILMLSLARQSDAVILLNHTVRNTTQPPGALANAGWQWEGQWREFLGTAISKTTFITAGHVGGNVGDNFTLNGVQYKTTARWDDPESDLQIWSIKGRFPTWAPILKTPAEIGKPMIVYGRGTQRGQQVVVNNQLKGWLWGNADHEESWGMNVITASTAGRADPDAGGGRIRGAVLYWNFDRLSGLKQESMLSVGDSGGGMFIQTGNTWSLAGVNLAAQSMFSYPDSTDVLNGALLDIGGLKMGGKLITDAEIDLPAASYATRVSLRASWIKDVWERLIAPDEAVSASLSTSPGSLPEPGNFLGVMVILAGLRIRTSGPADRR